MKGFVVAATSLLVLGAGLGVPPSSFSIQHSDIRAFSIRH
jgi:hypothetical protein